MSRLKSRVFSPPEKLNLLEGPKPFLFLVIGTVTRVLRSYISLTVGLALSKMRLFISYDLSVVKKS